MTDLFYDTAANRLDNLQVDVEKLYTTFPPGPTARALLNQVPFAQTPLHRLYRSRLQRGTLARDQSLGITLVQKPDAGSGLRLPALC